MLDCSPVHSIAPKICIYSVIHSVIKSSSNSNWGWPNIRGILALGIHFCSVAKKAMQHLNDHSFSFSPTWTWLLGLKTAADLQLFRYICLWLDVLPHWAAVSWKSHASSLSPTLDYHRSEWWAGRLLNCQESSSDTLYSRISVPTWPLQHKAELSYIYLRKSSQIQWLQPPEIIPEQNCIDKNSVSCYSLLEFMCISQICNSKQVW